MLKAEENNAQNATVGKMTAEKKKATIALVLIVIMASLWIKNIIKKDPVQDAQALASAQQNADVPKEIKFSYVPLPQSQDRHNALTRDVFVPNRWKGFRQEGDSGNDYWMSQALGGSGEEMSSIERAVNEMALGAIVIGKEHQAFIEGKMLSAGQTFTFKYNNQPYEFKILGIDDNKVELQCDDTIVVKKIKQLQFEDDE